jgi:hypothetical protein
LLCNPKISVTKLGLWIIFLLLRRKGEDLCEPEKISREIILASCGSTKKQEGHTSYGEELATKGPSDDPLIIRTGFFWRILSQRRRCYLSRGLLFFPSVYFTSRKEKQL